MVFRKRPIENDPELVEKHQKLREGAAEVRGQLGILIREVTQKQGDFGGNLDKQLESWAASLQASYDVLRLALDDESSKPSQIVASAKAVGKAAAMVAVIESGLQFAERVDQILSSTEDVIDHGDASDAYSLEEMKWTATRDLLSWEASTMDYAKRILEKLFGRGSRRPAQNYAGSDQSFNFSPLMIPICWRPARLVCAASGLSTKSWTRMMLGFGANPAARGSNLVTSSQKQSNSMRDSAACCPASNGSNADPVRRSDGEVMGPVKRDVDPPPLRASDNARGSAPDAGSCQRMWDRFDRRQ